MVIDVRPSYSLTGFFLGGGGGVDEYIYTYVDVCVCVKGRRTVALLRGIIAITVRLSPHPVVPLVRFSCPPLLESALFVSSCVVPSHRMSASSKWTHHTHTCMRAAAFPSRTKKSVHVDASALKMVTPQQTEKILCLSVYWREVVLTLFFSTLRFF